MGVCFQVIEECVCCDWCVCCLNVMDVFNIKRCILHHINGTSCDINIINFISTSRPVDSFILNMMYILPIVEVISNISSMITTTTRLCTHTHYDYYCNPAYTHMDASLIFESIVLFPSPSKMSEQFIVFDNG